MATVTTCIRRGACSLACTGVVKFMTDKDVYNRTPIKRMVSVWGYLVS